MTEPLRIVVARESETEWGACCLEDIEFITFAPTYRDLVAGLEAALEDYFGENVAYWIVNPIREPH